MGTPSPITQPKATLGYQRLLRREITPVEYGEVLKREAQDDAKTFVFRRRKAQAAA